MNSLRFKFGFSLVEVLVSMSLLAIVVTTGIGTLVVLMDANSKAQEKKELMNQVAFALDSMTREIRTGAYYQCGATTFGGNATNDCPAGGSVLTFTEGGDSLTGSLSSNRIAYRHNNGAIERSLGTSGFAPITPPDVAINSLEFIVTGTDQLVSGGDTEPPVVTVLIEASIPAMSGPDSTFLLQSTITQRELDI